MEAGFDQTPTKVDASNGFWARIRAHKVIQWGVAYLGAALALAHGDELVSHALQWPEIVSRVFVLALIVGFPIALTLAWYHGHRSLSRISAGELAIVSLLTLIGAIFFTVSLRPETEHGPAVRSGGTSNSPSGSPAGQEPLRARLQHSVAVLPPRNLSPDPKDADFAGGIQEEIINRLAKLKALTVIARTSTMRYANTDKTIQQIGEELNVETVMESSVRYADDRVRIETTLLDAVSGSPLWSEAYERDFRDYFSIQADIAMNVANALKAAFSPEEQRQVENVPTTSSEAYRLGIQLNDLSVRGNESTRIIAIARQAIAHDPNFALPYGYMAHTYSTLLINSTYGPAGDPAQLEPLVHINAERARELDPTGALGVLASANVEMFHWRWANAQRRFEDYLKSQPGPSGYLVWFLSWSGQSERAIDVAQKAIERDPNSWGVYWFLGWVNLYAGHTDRAVTALQRAIDLAPALPNTHGLLAWAEIARGHKDDALRELQLSETLIGANNRSIMYLVDLLYCFSRLGREDDVKRLSTELQTLASDQDLGTGGWATVYLATGQRSKALEQLRLGAERARNKVLDPGFFSLMNIRMNLGRDPVLEQPEFVDVRKRLQGD